jgi:signal transduction histidine kinase
MIINKFAQNYAKKNGIIIGLILLGIISSFAYLDVTYTYNKEMLYKDVDKLLKTTALSASLMLDDSFYERAQRKEGISKEEDMKNIKYLSQLTDKSDIEYVYVMIEKKGKIYFITSSALAEEMGTEDMTRFLDGYDEATPLLRNVLKTNQISYEESTDKWGTFRTVFLPLKTKNGYDYIVGADIKVDFIQERLNKYLFIMGLLQMFIFTLLAIFGYYFYKLSKKEIQQITELKEGLDKEIEEKTEEIREVNASLAQKIEDEVAKNREKDKQLLQQSRLAQMGEMISMIAHQWRQPLSAISATSASLELKATLGTLENEKIIELSQKISGYAQHLSATIDDFRNFFKANKEKVPTNIQHLIESTLGIVEVSLQNKNIEIKKEFHCNAEFLTYENEVKQVILNLIKNAEDILLEKGVKSPFIELYSDCGISGKNPTIFIKDNAGGVPEDIKDKIFNPYFSTKIQKDGTGLGLYMSKIIIEEHCHGKLSFYNENNCAVFKIEFNPKEDER